MTVVSQARVPTPHARKYALQLGRHWQHNLAVEESGDMRRIEASEPGQLEGLKGAVERHVARFAFREDGLSYDWEDVASREPGASE
jgi:hypothetical protein